MHQYKPSDLCGTKVQAAPPLEGDAMTLGAGFGGTETPPQVLARLPDLDATKSVPQAADAKPVRSDGRMISQGLSRKLLVGGAVLLVLTAIIPLMVGKKSDPKPDGPKLPAWHPGTPAPDAEMAPTWKTWNDRPAPDSSTPDGLAPKGSSLAPDLQFAPPSMTFRSDSPPPRPALPPAAGESTTRDAQRPPVGYDNRHETGPPSPGTFHDYRQPSTEPGVARLEGTIEKPSVRTTYDRARSSIY